MTLRELIECVTTKGFFNKTVTQLQILHGDHPDTQQVIRKYRNVVDQMLDLPGDDRLNDHTIVIDSGVDAANNEYIKVYLRCGQDNTWGVDFIDWNELIDLPIQDKISNELSGMLAHILYELTWWGFTRESVNQQRTELENVSKDNIVEFNLNELDNNN